MVAAKLLERSGYRVVERNYRCQEGEIDIVARLAHQWIFVEVKTRQGRSHGLPEDAVTADKAARLLRVGESYLQEHNLRDVAWRVDVIAVELDSRGTLTRIEHFESAVSGW